MGSGLDTHQAAGDKIHYEFKFEQPSFPGSIAVVQDDPVKVHSEGVTTSLYFRGAEADMAQRLWRRDRQDHVLLHRPFGLPPYANLTLVETEAGAPNGYSAPGLIFLSPRGHRQATVSAELLANQISRQWWEELVSPVHAQSPVARPMAWRAIRSCCGPSMTTAPAPWRRSFTT